ncbi:zf-HC2 domain-containing protein [Nonomuraea sp. NPDC050310]|uniref:anti-sigma factor family protein n=1 Tax=unclassified Nonomuraea TaxID=2593643 RepID=UPI0033FF6750
MTGDTHYDLEILAELAEGLLDAGTATRVREHLAVCDPCGERLADLAAVREVLAATPVPAMPVGVAKRIEQALAAERSGVGVLVEDAPPVVEEPVRLGVVADDGTIVPAAPSRRRRRTARRWAMPAAAVAAAAAVIGTVTVTNLAATGTGSSLLAGPSSEGPQASPSMNAALAYSLTQSDYNYSAATLRQPLSDFLAPATIINDPGDVSKCATEVRTRTKRAPFAVDRAMYNGNEALIMVSWRNQAAKQVYIDVVDPFFCKPIRKATTGSW